MSSKEEKSSSVGVVVRVKSKFRKQFGDVILTEFENSTVSEPIICVGFQGVTITPVLATGYIVEQLGGLPLIGSITSRKFQPKSIIQNNQCGEVIRIVGSATAGVVAFQSELKSFDNELSHDLVDAVIDFADRHKAKFVVSMEGLPMNIEEIEQKLSAKEVDAISAEERRQLEKTAARFDRVRFITTDSDLAIKLQKSGHIPLRDGVVAGISGLILARLSSHVCEDGRVIEGGCFLAPCSARFPDARSALNVVKVVSKYLLSNKIDVPKLESKQKDLWEKLGNLIHASNAPRSSDLSLT